MTNNKHDCVQDESIKKLESKIITQKQLGEETFAHVAVLEQHQAEVKSSLAEYQAKILLRDQTINEKLDDITVRLNDLKELDEEIKGFKKTVQKSKRVGSSVVSVTIKTSKFFLAVAVIYGAWKYLRDESFLKWLLQR